jgi:holliday junction resolvase YEN1
MSDPFQKITIGTDYDTRQAPGEAEAELALMNSLGIIDAVITDDSDIFLFGAVTVIRK